MNENIKLTEDSLYSYQNAGQSSIFLNEQISVKQSKFKELHEIKRQRLEKEIEAQRLRNRVEYLIQQEIKQEKIAKEQQKKALEIYYQKQKNEVLKLMSKNKSQSVEKKILPQIKTNHEELKQQKVLEVKELKQQIKEQILKKKNDLDQEAKQRTQRIKELQQQWRARIYSHQIEKINQVHDGISKQLENEKKFHEQKDQEIKQLEKVKIEVDLNLQGTLKMAKQASKQFKSAISLRPTQYADKFLSEQKEQNIQSDLFLIQSPKESGGSVSNNQSRPISNQRNNRQTERVDQQQIIQIIRPKEQINESLTIKKQRQKDELIKQYLKQSKPNKKITLQNQENKDDLTFNKQKQIK